jgi:WS/DGAT/MGAT family acyltransferase
MHKLGILDASFLYAETPSTPMNIASLQLLELPAEAGPGWFDALKSFLAARVGLIPFMTKRLKATPFTLDQPVWVAARDFDIDRHVKRVVVPPPGDLRALEKLVARLHEAAFDRRHPLWSFTLIDGLGPALSPSTNGRRVVGWYCKYHHACIDGMAGQAIIDVLFRDDAKTLPPPSPGGHADAEPGFLDLLFDAAKGVVDQSLRGPEQWGAQLRATMALGRRALAGGKSFGAFGESAPRTRFNVAVGPYRAFAAGTLPLPTVRKLAKSVHASVNDVVLAVTAAGLRRYLRRRGELPERPLLVGVPVSLREAGDTRMRNQVTMLIASLATDVDDPIARLEAIKRSARLGKEVLVEARALQVEDLHVPGLPAVMAGAAQVAERLRIADLVGGPVNLVVSNVMGPTRPKYLFGARMLTHYPVSIPAHSAALNVTVQSYCDRVDLGVTACLDAVPDAHVLRDDILEGWTELRDALGFRETPLAPAAAA